MRKNGYPLPGRACFGYCLALVLTLLVWTMPSVASAQLGDAPVTVSIEIVRMDGSSGDLLGGELETGTLAAVVLLKPAPPGYIYANTPGPTGLPTQITVTSSSTPVGATLYPKGKQKKDAFEPDKTVSVYDKETAILVPLPAFPGGQLDLKVKVKGLYCTATRCVPVSKVAEFSGKVDAPSLPVFSGEDSHRPSLSKEVPVAAPGVVKTDESLKEADTAPFEFKPQFFQPALEVGGLIKAVLFALLAGFILNFMPCVLPVVSLKLKGLISGHMTDSPEQANSSFRIYNVFFAAGIIVWFLALAAVLSILDLAWGQIFQNSSVVLGLTVLIFALGLSLLGVFTLPIIDLRSGPGTGSKSASEAFFTGVLATLLATPCSGPFLGGVLAWTLMQSPLIIAIVFACIGIGMALPYLFMAIRPQVLGVFQKPGSWTIYLEKLAAFFLLGTCIYLLQILPPAMLIPALIALLCTAFAAWMWGSWTNLSQPRRKRWGIRLLAIILLFGAYFWAAQPQPAPAHWREYDKKQFEEMLGNTPMLLDFTADWCPSCKFLELTVLTEELLTELKKDYGAVFIKVDLTEPDPEKEALLEAMGSKSIPLVALFPAGEKAREPVILRDLFTTRTLDEAVTAAY